MSEPQIAELLRQHEQDLLQDWLQALRTGSVDGRALLSDEALVQHCSDLLEHLQQALARHGAQGTEGEAWQSLRQLLSEIVNERVRQGSSPAEVATFVFSLKQPLFGRLRERYPTDCDSLAAEIWSATEVVDRLGLWSMESYSASREAVILRQQQDLLELSTPVVKLWEGVLAVPMIGTLDSARTQVVMETLLTAVVQQNAEMAIIDITGVPTVDTLVAQHLLKTVTATRLMGADCIISGIRPQIAQTIVHLGVDLKDIITKASLADAFRMTLERMGIQLHQDHHVTRS